MCDQGLEVPLLANRQGRYAQIDHRPMGAWSKIGRSRNG